MKKLIKKRVVSSKNGVKSIQIVGYNGAHTVIFMMWMINYLFSILFIFLFQWFLVGPLM